MAAPIYRDEFERRMQNMMGFVKTSVDSLRYEINSNTDAKFLAVIKHYDEQHQETNRRLDALENMIRRIGQALNITDI